MRLSLDNIAAVREERARYVIGFADNPMQTDPQNTFRHTMFRAQLLDTLTKRYNFDARAEDLVLTETPDEPKQLTDYELVWAPATTDTEGLAIDGPHQDEMLTVVDTSALVVLDDSSYRLHGWDDQVHAWTFTTDRG